MGCDGNLWVTAKIQEAGKARRGREWVSREGNLFASLLLFSDVSTSDTSTLPFVASLAVADAICKLAPPEFDLASVKIKWPNDVLLSGQKISGILLEATMLPSGKRAIIIGCGINCAHSPDNALYPATSLSDEGFEVSVNKVFSTLCNSMHHYLTIWNDGSGFAEIRQEWLKKASGIGELITARFENHSESGKFVDIDHQGRLILETTNGEKLISAADIFFGLNQKDGNTKP